MREIKLKLTMLEHVALGYALGCGVATATRRKDTTMLKELDSLFTKVHKAQAKESRK